MYPVLFKIGPITIFSYGFLLMVAFIVGTLLAMREARRKGLDGDVILDMAPWVLVASIVGARLVFVALQWSQFREQPVEVLKVWTGGLSFHGGLAGAILAGAWYARRRQLSFWRLADAVAVPLPLCYAIGRVGCFLNGCCYGGPTDLPWACQFQDPTAPGGLTPPSHPVQLYAAAINVGLFFVLQAVARRVTVPGQVLVAYILLYSLYRFGIEFLRRGATAQILPGGITSAQLASLLLAAVAIAGLFVLQGKRQEAVGRRQAAGGSRR